LLAKTPEPDAFEALFAAATGLFFSLYDELDPRARRRAVASLRVFADNIAGENPFAAELCRGAAAAAASGLTT
jgi:hypothetical protein